MNNSNRHTPPDRPPPATMPMEANEMDVDGESDSEHEESGNEEISPQQAAHQQQKNQKSPSSPAIDLFSSAKNVKIGASSSSNYAGSVYIGPNAIAGAASHKSSTIQRTGVQGIRTFYQADGVEVTQSSEMNITGDFLYDYPSIMQPPPFPAGQYYAPSFQPPGHPWTGQPHFSPGGGSFQPPPNNWQYSGNFPPGSVPMPSGTNSYYYQYPATSSHQTQVNGEPSQSSSSRNRQARQKNKEGRKD